MTVVFMSTSCSQVDAASEQVEQDGHADGDAVADLVEDDARRVAGGGVGADLDAPVHGAGVHDDGLVAACGRGRPASRP